ncbi:uncharacterized protein LOC126891519 [Diabrotica virgifera virgifera]|uniref:HTH psq-type domain-containing protein n=1 Tax=Diabrotica virgifera virgifera TaxID=50390 RepID=A0ABM5L2J1_DIAVI|nr:uncharacterized protein LOC126891519 [Diabrotica virgifera virgifera]
MVREYKKTHHSRNGQNYTPYNSYTETNMQDALREIQCGNLTYREAATRYKVPRSTLYLRASNKNTFSVAGRPCALTMEEETLIIDHLKTLSAWGFPFDLLDLRLLVKSFLDKMGRVERRFTNNTPGPDWGSNFLKRHRGRISNRLSANISTKRAKVNRENLDVFFNNAKDVFKGIDPSLILNYDETNLTDNPGAKKFIFKRGCKYPERVVNSTKTAISLMFAGTADGQLLPEYTVYKADHMWDSWTQGGPVGARYNRSKSGWFDAACFEDWFFTIVVPFFRKKEGKKVCMLVALYFFIFLKLRLISYRL